MSSRDAPRRPSRSRSRSPQAYKRRYSRSRSRSFSPGGARGGGGYRDGGSRRDDYRDGGGRSGGGGPSRGRSRSPMSDRRRHIGNREAPEVSSCLGVFGLSLHTTERELENEFLKFGPLEKVLIVMDGKSGRSRGFGFVTFESVEDAKVARDAMLDQEIDGRRIRVDYSITKRPHTPTPGAYMGRPSYGNGGSRGGGGRYRDDDRGYRPSGGGGYRGGGGGGYRGDDRGRRDYDRRSPSPYRSRPRRDYRSRSRSYSPRRY